MMKYYFFKLKRFL